MLSWDEALALDTANRGEAEFRHGALSDRFLAPPFSTLDTRAGYWRDRKWAWLMLGIKSELGREGVGANPMSLEQLRAGHQPGGWAGPVQRAYPGPAEDDEAAGTSIFDPVLCELAYRWWCPAGGSILDPFAGGSVRGIVAAMLGHPYTGIDLSARQLDANRAQVPGILEAHHPVPTWLHGDSAQMHDLLPAGELYDLVFTCPPYYDLEVYSDDPADLSAMDTYAEFADAYAAILGHAATRLRDSRFMVIVVSEIRGPSGHYRGFVPDTILAAEAAGLRYYNEAVLINAVGSAPSRATRQFEGGRKLVRLHQNVLVFAKGPIDARWDYSRPAPPPPQLALALVVGDPPAAPVAPVAGPSATIEPLVAPAASLPAVAPLGPPVVEYSPVAGPHRGVLFKRDDLFTVGGANGGKARSTLRLAGDSPAGFVTAASRQSVQIGVVARIAAHLGVPCLVYAPTGHITAELEAVLAAGAQLEQVAPGYTSVLTARGKAAAAERGWIYVPWGMECAEHVAATADQVGNLPWGQFRRLVVPVGSGMSLAGVLTGLIDHAPEPVDVLGVAVGASPTARLDAWVPGWADLVQLVDAQGDYHDPAPVTDWDGLALDPFYEAKCIPFLQEGDLLWVVGSRPPALVPAAGHILAPTAWWWCTTCRTRNPAGYIRPTADGQGQGECYTCGDFRDFIYAARLPDVPIQRQEDGHDEA